MTFKCPKCGQLYLLDKKEPKQFFCLFEGCDAIIEITESRRRLSVFDTGNEIGQVVIAHLFPEIYQNLPSYTSVFLVSNIP